MAASGWTATYSVNGKTIAQRGRSRRSTSNISRTARTGRPALARPTWRQRSGPEGHLDRHDHAAKRRPAPIPPLLLGLCQGVRRRPRGARPLAAELEPLVPQFRRCSLTAGQPHDIRIEWDPDGGYIALLHNDPRPEADRHSLTLSSELGARDRLLFHGGGNMDEVIAGYRAADRQGADHAQMGLRLLAEPPALRDAGPTARRAARISQARPAARQYRPGLALLAAGPMGLPVLRSGALPRSQGDGRRDPRQRRAHDDLGLGEILSEAPPNYKELDAVGGIYRNMVTPAAGRAEGPQLHQGMYRDWVGPGYSNAFYDPYNPAARRHLLAPGPRRHWRKGFDAWWLDSDEPDFHSNLSIAERIRRMSPTAPARPQPSSIHIRSSMSKAFTTTWSPYKPDVRPFILTRSGFGGIQRDGAAVWSGDVASRWDNFREQISAGVNFSHVGRAQLEPRHRRLHDGAAIPEAHARRPRRMARAQHCAGSSSALSRRSSEATARTSSARSSRCRRRARRPTSRWSGTTGCVTG